ncbi:conserved hypothetical protein [uncultured Desulfobacterium sp.]|uniref:S-adenosyl-l-methionine hydroxide adenosyltransferase n=1 Tax=uncultured Desulfobacterium sp. TaxID=201089 RepID=A0A445N233_9BACT|nr:conserved hypothetical protein [uncultured Desulfobacterium sp.]
MNPSGIITLTTDFGLSDPYVGIMKGVILSINPEARIIDITHHVSAGDIGQASSILFDAYRFFPEGTIHLGVVDPGVGGERRPIMVITGSHFLIGPDNGLFWPVIFADKVVKLMHLTNESYFLSSISRTFHGRDIFAPVAAHVSRGVSPLEMGQTITDPVRLDLPICEQEGDILRGSIIRVDHFGNLLTSIPKKDVEKFFTRGSLLIRVGDATINGVKGSYSEAKEGELISLIGSSDHLEIAVNRGRACDGIGVESARLVGTRVELIVDGKC